MNASNIVIIQVDTHQININQSIQDLAKFYNYFGNTLIIVFHEKIFEDNNILSQLIVDNLNISISILNTIAKNRLISNFDNSYPEISFVIMSCGENSKLIKIKDKIC